MKTILITGCSSGFGLETARYFLDRGWNVIATMRTLDANLLPASPRLRLLALDVTDAASIARAVDEVDTLDVLVNNAGIGLRGVVEATPMQTIHSVFEANTLGTIAVTQAFLPLLRQKRDAVLINVTSSTTLKPLPMLAAYTASKAAVEAFTACLSLEVAPFGIRTHLVLPGSSPETRFRTTAQGQINGGVPEAYQAFAQSVMATISRQTKTTESADVTRAIWLAANDATAPFRIPCGADAVAVAQSQSI